MNPPDPADVRGKRAHHKEALEEIIFYAADEGDHFGNGDRMEAAFELGVRIQFVRANDDGVMADVGFGTDFDRAGNNNNAIAHVAVDASLAGNGNYAAADFAVHFQSAGNDNNVTDGFALLHDDVTADLDHGFVMFARESVGALCWFDPIYFIVFGANGFFGLRKILQRGRAID